MINRMIAMAVPALLVVLVAVSPARSADDRQFLYQWTDDRGNTSIVDSLDKVPPKYRQKARALDQGGAPAPAPAAAAEATAAPAALSPDEESDRMQQAEDAKKAEWQQRVLAAKRQLAAAEDRYRQLDAAKADLMSKWGSSGAALPPQEVVNQMNQLTADMEKTRVEIDKLNNDINNVIPDEARRAGVPPGWIREVQ